MICVVADLAIMSTSYENAMPNAMSSNINALKCILYITWHSYIQYNKHVKSINSMFLNLYGISQFYNLGIKNFKNYYASMLYTQFGKHVSK